MNADELKAYKAKQIRYKKPICKDLNIDSIQEEIEDINCECDEIAYYIEQTDDDTLINALCGDEDEAYEFRMAFADLSANCYEMYNDLQETYIPKWFDLFFVAVSNQSHGDSLLGWDNYETDYYGLDIYEREWAKKESQEKLKKLTKKELFEGVESCLKILYAYIGIKDRYTNLKVAFDILKGQNADSLKLVKHIEELYEKTAEVNFEDWKPETKKFENLINLLPEEAWLW